MVNSNRPNYVALFSLTLFLWYSLRFQLQINAWSRSKFVICIGVIPAFRPLDVGGACHCRWVRRHAPGWHGSCSLQTLTRTMCLFEVEIADYITDNFNRFPSNRWKEGDKSEIIAGNKYFLCSMVNLYELHYGCGRIAKWLCELAK